MISMLCVGKGGIKREVEFLKKIKRVVEIDSRTYYTSYTPGNTILNCLTVPQRYKSTKETRPWSLSIRFNWPYVYIHSIAGLERRTVGALEGFLDSSTPHVRHGVRREASSSSIWVELVLDMHVHRGFINKDVRCPHTEQSCGGSNSGKNGPAAVESEKQSNGWRTFRNPSKIFFFCWQMSYRNRNTEEVAWPRQR